MKVVILCGGKGTRLREETEYKPKPMVEIGGRPILWHIMKLYAYYGHKDFILCLGYKGNVIKEYFLNYEFMNSDFTVHLGTKEAVVTHNGHEEDWNVTLADTGFETPKGGRLLRVQPYLADETEFMLTYGDGIADVNIEELLKCHRTEGKIVTFTGVRPRSRFASVQISSDGSVVGWKEKKQLRNFINGGFFVFHSEIFEYLTDDVELEEEPLEKLAHIGHVSMYKHHGFWECMDTYRDYKYLNDLYDKGVCPWAVWNQQECLTTTTEINV